MNSAMFCGLFAFALCLFVACSRWGARKKHSGAEINRQADESGAPADERAKIEACIGEIVDLIAEKIGNQERQVNPRDAILCSGNLIGMFMFLSFDLKYQELEPGSVLLSDEANSLGPKIISRLLHELDAYGIKIDSTASPVVYESPLTYLDMLGRTQNDAIEIMRKYGFDCRQAMIICTSAAAFIIQNVRAGVDANEGVGIATYGIIQGSKTVPYK